MPLLHSPRFKFAMDMEGFELALTYGRSALLRLQLEEAFRDPRVRHLAQLAGEIARPRPDLRLAVRDALVAGAPLHSGLRAQRASTRSVGRILLDSARVWCIVTGHLVVVTLSAILYGVLRLIRALVTEPRPPS